MKDFKIHEGDYISTVDGYIGYVTQMLNYGADNIKKVTITYSNKKLGKKQPFIINITDESYYYPIFKCYVPLSMMFNQIGLFHFYQEGEIINIYNKEGRCLGKCNTANII